MELSTKYNPAEVEAKWYDFWMDNRLFESTPDDREPYTIVIPPPNVTGVLHMGHMLNNTIQDVLIRKARLSGKNACWVPGTDHASIATEAKVVARLKEQGIAKSALSREEFLKHAWDWTDEYGGTILKQLRKLGCSCDWSRTKFTLDDDMYASVIKVFVDLYQKGHIYRGYRMVNWDPVAKTTLSDEEVIYEERQGELFQIAYKLVDSDEQLIIATTRPETIFGDTAICINPNDERFFHLHNRKAIVPICNREIPIILDEYVDMEFGTGCLKVTPAHDVNDKTLGEKHKLEVIDIFNEDASLNSYGIQFEGQDRFEARKNVVKTLDEIGVLVKREKYINNVGTSERTKAVIEPRLSDQWFLSMQELVKPALKSVLETKEVQLVPEKFENTYRHWMENIRDWNISRQLWWGQQIPAYYFSEDKEEFVVAETPEKALVLAQEKLKDRGENRQLTTDDLRQDSDVLDTWFSSWLWPISVFNGILEPENEQIEYYYPTQDLVTGPDILFFWVARMIIAGYEYRGKQPFSKVYLTGLVRDKQRRKMSKSLGNSPDALELISNHGADGVRVGLLLSSAAGNDLLFDEALCQQGKNFANKIWNAFRLIQGFELSETIEQPVHSAKGVFWFQQKFNAELKEIEQLFERYKISEALMRIYKLIWDDFCSWLLEIIKPEYQKPIDQKTYKEVLAILEDLLILLHPFMPFLSEELWQHLKKRESHESICVAKWPESKEVKPAVLQEFDYTSEVISGIRTVRKEKQIPQKEALELYYLENEKYAQIESIIKKLGNISAISKVDETPEGAISFRVKSNEFSIPILGAINVEDEISKLKEELAYTEGFLISVQKKLSNERFVSNAPEKVVLIEKKKEEDAKLKIDSLKSSLKSLGENIS